MGYAWRGCLSSQRGGHPTISDGRIGSRTVTASLRLAGLLYLRYLPKLQQGEDFPLVPKNETARAVACGNGTSSVEARGRSPNEMWNCLGIGLRTQHETSTPHHADERDADQLRDFMIEDKHPAWVR